MDTRLLNLKQGISRLAVIGQGYVGLPVALAFAEHFEVVGFDIDPQKIASLKNRIDPGKEVTPAEFEGKKIQFTHQVSDLGSCQIFIVAVPTPVDANRNPDLHPLLSACESIGPFLRKDAVVIFESTVYPGCSEEDCAPVLEKFSGLKRGTDFFIGYSPERINPGDAQHTLANIIKVVSGENEVTLNLVAGLYTYVAHAGVHKAPSIRVAEAAKIIENTQRDLNIALMNELSMIFHKMDIDTHDVLAAAGTKWNFLKFTPGLVGGHCIGVDPYYLTHKAARIGHHPEVITAGRSINDGMASWVVQEFVYNLRKIQPENLNPSALILGLTFKPNVADLRNSKVRDVFTELKSQGFQVDIQDRVVEDEAVRQLFGQKPIAEINARYDLVVLAVPHKAYAELSPEFYKNVVKENGLFADLGGVFRNQWGREGYWTL